MPPSAHLGVIPLTFKSLNPPHSLSPFAYPISSSSFSFLRLSPSQFQLPFPCSLHSLFDRKRSLLIVPLLTIFSPHCISCEMPFLQRLLMMLTIFGTANASLEMSADATFNGNDLGKRKAEDAIPVIEIRGEGKPMSSAQIRHLEELSNGGPLDVKTETIWKSATCERKVQRNDYVTFHYKCFTEDGKKITQSYGGEPVKMQVGVGMASRGLDKGLLGMCVEELRKITIPYRLSRKGKSVVWKNLPNDEHWITMQIELLSLTPYTHEEQFRFLDFDNDTKVTKDDLINWSKGMKKNYGKTWKNDQIDTVLAAKYYIKYFDVNRDGFVDLNEFEEIMKRDEKLMKREKVKAKGRRRDPGFAWILDFNNDGVVTFEENDEAPNHFEKDPVTLPYQINKEEL